MIIRDAWSDSFEHELYISENIKNGTTKTIPDFNDKLMAKNIRLISCGITGSKIRAKETNAKKISCDFLTMNRLAMESVFGTGATFFLDPPHAKIEGAGEDFPKKFVHEYRREAPSSRPARQEIAPPIAPKDTA